MRKKREFSDDLLKYIADYRQDHSLSETMKMFDCKRKDVSRAVKMFDESCSDWPKPTLSWVSPSLAAGQHEHFLGRSI